jgi:hypothetical protein
MIFGGNTLANPNEKKPGEVLAIWPNDFSIRWLLDHFDPV